MTVPPGDSAVPPFWQRMPSFFLYPLTLVPLLMVLGLSLALLLFTSIGPVIGFIGVLLLGAVFIRFAFAVLEQTALGRLHPAEQRLFDRRDQEGLPLMVLGLLGVVIVSTALSAAGGRFVYFVVASGWSLALPAAVMILAMSGSLQRALDPSNLLFVVRRIGMPYFGLCGLLFIIPGGIKEILPLLAGLQPVQLFVALACAVTLYFALLLFHLMGYVLYQYHEALDLEVEVGFEARRDRRGQVQAVEDAAAEPIGRLLAEGRLEEALKLADSARLQAPERFAFQLRYLKLLLLAGKVPQGLQFAAPLISSLLQQGRGDDALELFQACRSAEPAFATLGVNDVVPLAEAAWKRRLPDLALGLIRSFATGHPQHEHAPASYFLAARILSEHYRQDEHALQFLDALLQRYPQAAVQAEAAAYRQVLQRLQSSN